MEGYICDACQKVHQGDDPQGWVQVEVLGPPQTVVRIGQAIAPVEFHLCSPECVVTWAERIVQKKQAFEEDDAA